MFDFGESGYGEYRATQSGGSSDSGAGVAALILIIMGLPFVAFFAAFIGCFLYYSMGGK